MTAACGRTFWLRLVTVCAAVLGWMGGSDGQETGNRRPVKVVAEELIAVGTAELPLYISRDWSVPLPGVRRAVLVLHGYLRNADVYYRMALKAQVAAGSAGADSMLIAPQFLAEIDMRAHHLPASTLHWSLNGWEGGEPAEGPTHASSFDAFDAILGRLADRRLFPDLKEIVIAGHSGGAQVTQRYAVLGRGEAVANAARIHVRYVVANPSSYAWFTARRPAQAMTQSCSGYNQWKYGMDALPPYASGQAIRQVKERYAARDVVYLLGTADTNPNDRAMDKSCMAEAEGPYRYARGHAYFQSLQAMFGTGLRQTEHDVPGVGHDGDRMLTSECGLAALFNTPGCGS